jgi:hypothetical protein
MAKFVAVTGINRKGYRRERNGRPEFGGPDAFFGSAQRAPLLLADLTAGTDRPDY